MGKLDGKVAIVTGSGQGIRQRNCYWSGKRGCKSDN